MSESVWRVGVLFSETGVTAAVERTQRAATLLAIDQVNAAGGVRGRRIEVVAYDPASSPDKYRVYAKRMCDDDKVRVIFGCKMSSTRKAVLPIIETRDALLFYPTLYEGFEYSQHCIYTGAAPNQDSVQLVDYLAANFGKRVLLIGSNYVFPYESNRVVGDLFKQLGGKVVDEMYFPLDVRSKSDFGNAIGRIRETAPDVIYSSIVGDGIAMFYEAYADAGFNPQTMPIGSLSTSEAEIGQMAPGVAAGHILSATYFSSLDTPKSKRFIEAFASQYGYVGRVNSNAESAYFQVFLYASALEAAGSDALQDLLPHLYEVEVDAPQGPVRIDKENNHTYLWPRVAKIGADGVPRVVLESGQRVRPDPFMVGQRADAPNLLTAA